MHLYPPTAIRNLTAIVLSIVFGYVGSVTAVMVDPSPQPSSSPAPSATPTPSTSPAPSSTSERSVPQPSEFSASMNADSNGTVNYVPESESKRMNQRIYVDEDYDLKVAAPTGWYRMNSRQYTAPGDLLRVWNPGSETVIMVYRYLYEELVMPMELLDKTAEIASEQLHADILEQELRTIAGKRATWLVFSGPGTGGMVNGRGNIQTVQHVVAFPRVDDTIVFLLVSPEADYKKYAPDFENMLASLEMGGHQTDAQANDK